MTGEILLDEGIFRAVISHTHSLVLELWMEIARHPSCTIYLKKLLELGRWQEMEKLCNSLYKKYGWGKICLLL